MSELAGAATLARLVLRRDRLRIAVWTVSIVLLEVLSAWSTKGLYPTRADLQEAAAAAHGNAAAIALNGPDQALDTTGGQVAFQIGTNGLVAVALMAVFMVGRETRAEEEAGRLELVRAMAVGRHASLAAALSVVAAMSAAVGGLTALGLIALDLPAAGSILFGATLLLEGLVFAGVTVVAAQSAQNTRVTYGAVGAVLGAAFVLRAAGDIGDGTLSWLSPIGWAQKTRPFAGERWWPALLMAAAAVALVAAGSVLSTLRDVDAGFVAPRPGPRTARPYLGRPLGLALRLQRGALIGWSTGLLLTGAAFGWIADDVEDLVGDNENLREVIARTGGASLTDAFLATEVLLVALIATGYAVQAALRVRGEETALRAEPLLATPLSRRRWLAAHLVVALAGSVVVLAAAGLGSGLMYGLVSHDLSQVPRMLGATLVYVPALWLFAGLATLLFGLVPRGVALTWGAFAACFAIGMLGEALNLPTWVNDASPFHHTPSAPSEDPAATPLTILLAIAAALTLGGILAFRRRDV
ncbi:ABC transporter permease, partial [Spirillospora sp. NPDC048911]|uniref:ABC transporter permease n=1 Tax=Spirillospora sp. NPDC048911 TaxID=3364527 RepID=UPI00371621D7